MQGIAGFWFADYCAKIVPDSICALCVYGCLYVYVRGVICSGGHQTCHWKMSHKYNKFLSRSILLRDWRTKDTVSEDGTIMPASLYLLMKSLNQQH